MPIYAKPGKLRIFPFLVMEIDGGKRLFQTLNVLLQKIDPRLVVLVIAEQFIL